nr:immunoglobulin light chain junction region [Macaca mulatta]MOW59965.1 immunoglobulin light chain junction region [Macaca mulatta]MOY05676.1 immunoglobulin light chain junction region [Macaca mulatta]MOY06833.1 immunoglobulin light chain junction region [Macaca mulatta]MOY08699.1 immunoglobulin light chain junction region [Macaca mulatta]
DYYCVIWHNNVYWVF